MYITARKRTRTREQSPPALGYLLSLWICLFWTLYKWNHNVWTFVPASFTSKVYSCCSVLSTLPLTLQDNLEITPYPHSFGCTLLILTGKVFIIQDSNGIKSVCEAIGPMAFHAHPAQSWERTRLPRPRPPPWHCFIYIILRDEKQYPQGVFICSSLWLSLSIFFICFRESTLSLSVNGLIVPLVQSSIGWFVFFWLICGNVLRKWPYELEIFSQFGTFPVTAFGLSFANIWIMQKNV